MASRRRHVHYGSPPVTLWTPAALGANLMGWWDPSDAATVTLSSGDVSNLNDKSSNARHLLQNFTGERPGLTSNGIGGRAVMTFNGDQGLYNASAFMYANGNVFVLMVMKGGTAPNLGAWISEADRDLLDPAYAPIRAQNTGHVDLKIQYVNNAGTAVSTYTLFPDVLNNVAHVLGFRDTGSLFKSTIDGTAPNAGDSYTRSTTTLDRFSIGGRMRTSITGGCTGSIGEVLVMKGAVSAGDEAKAIGYLAHRWGTTGLLPGGHAYKTSPPTT